MSLAPWRMEDNHRTPEQQQGRQTRDSRRNLMGGVPPQGRTAKRKCQGKNRLRGATSSFNALSNTTLP